MTSFTKFTAARIETLAADQWAAHDPRTAAEVALFERALDRSSKLMTRLAAIGLDSERIHYLRVREARTLGNWVADLMNRIFARTGFDWRPADVSAIVAEEIRAMPDPGRWW